jgi:hypothetical protein
MRTRLALATALVAFALTPSFAAGAQSPEQQLAEATYRYSR